MNNDAETLRLLSPLLDQALALDDIQRETWLGSIDTQQPELAPLLRKVLSKEAAKATASLLEKRPAIVGLDGADIAVADHVRGELVGPYKLLSQIGRGGMGDVWLATRSDGVLKRAVALKLPVVGLRRSVLLQRFERERDILAALNHPHIARLYDAGFADDGQPYLALEYVPGQSITEYAAGESLDARSVVRLLRQVTDAVQYAHANLVIHRDLKPSNVLVTEQGKALLLDFGIAKLLQEEDGGEAHESELTKLGGGALTLHYAAPEQIAGAAISIAADVWALGILLYELLTGHRPFEGANRGTLEDAVRTIAPTPPRQLKTGRIAGLSTATASELDNIVLKALKKLPGERYTTVSAFADDLDRWLNGEAVLAQPDSRWYRTRKFVGRHRLAVTTATLAAVTVVSIAAVAVWLGIQAREESERAVATRDFLIDMFRQVDPDLSHGKDLTAKQLLEQGKQRILTSLGSQPLLQSDLLRGIADAEANLADYRRADATLTEVVDRYQKLGKTLASGDAQVAHAYVVFKAGDTARAEKLLDEAWTKMNGDASPKVVLVSYYRMRSSLELTKGNFPNALAASRKSLDYAEQAFGPFDSKTIGALVTVAKVELAVGHYNVAGPLFDDAIARADRNPLNHPRDLLVLRADRAQMHAGAGWFRLAADQLAEIGERCDQVLDRHGESCTDFRRRESQMWLALGYHDRALKLLPAFLGRMANEESPQDQAEALMTACRILLFNGLQGEQAQWWARLNTLAQSGSEVKLAEQVKLWATLLGAERLVREVKPEAALNMLHKAEERNSRGKQQYSRRLLFHTRLLQGLAAQQLGQHETALRWMRDAQSLYPKQVAAEHPRYLLASLYQARSLWAINQRDKALALLDHALPTLLQTMGADSPIFVKAQSLRNELATTSPKPDSSRKVDIFL